MFLLHLRVADPPDRYRTLSSCLRTESTKDSTPEPDQKKCLIDFGFRAMRVEIAKTESCSAQVVLYSNPKLDWSHLVR